LVRPGPLFVAQSGASGDLALEFPKLVFVRLHLAHEFGIVALLLVEDALHTLERFLIFCFGGIMAASCSWDQGTGS
jgi:hypothetical protein